MIRCRKLVLCYTMFGILFGLLFPLTGLTADYLVLRPGAGSVAERIRTNPIHGIVALAPFVLGAVFHVIGRIQWSLRDRMETVEEAHLRLQDLQARLSQKNAELEEALERAQSADNAKSDFLAAMSHELRTPLNGVLGMSDLLVETELDTDQRGFVDVIRTSGRSLLGVINDILDYSKIDSGFLTIHAAPFPLRAMVEEPARLLSVLAAKKGLDLFVRVDPALPDFVSGDLTRLRQVVINLVGNAIKFTEAGRVEIDLGVDTFDDTLVRVEVRDTGCGIPPEQLGRVFERFSQVDGAQSRRQEGTGLGLAITKNLVELMDGFVEVRSEPGQGSVFSFTLPLAEAAAPEGEAAMRPTGRLADRRVLVVAENAFARASLTELLGSWGIAAAAAGTGAEALEVLGDAAPELILLDHKLPDMDACAAIAAIRARPDLGGVPVLVMSPVGGDGAPPGAADAAVFRLARPAEGREILDAVETALAEPEGDRGTAAAARPAPEVIAMPPARAGSAAPDGGRPVVLIADDNCTNVLVARKVVESMGLAVVSAADGSQALEAYRRHLPALVLMDVSMPVMDGHRASEEIRLWERASGTPPACIVGLTGHADAEGRAACLRHGMDDHMAKPIDVPALRGIVERVLSAPMRREA